MFWKGRKLFKIGDKVRPINVPVVALDTMHQIGADGVLFVRAVESKDKGKQALRFHDLEGEYPAFLFTSAE